MMFIAYLTFVFNPFIFKVALQTVFKNPLWLSETINTI